MEKLARKEAVVMRIIESNENRAGEDFLKPPSHLLLFDQQNLNKPKAKLSQRSGRYLERFIYIKLKMRARH